MAIETYITISDAVDASIQNANFKDLQWSRNVCNKLNTQKYEDCCLEIRLLREKCFPISINQY